MTASTNPLVVSYLTLRRMIGWVGLLMPLAVRLGGWWIEGIHNNGSISAYYYTDMRDLLVATLVLVGALVACYRTPAWHDNVVSVAMGVAAIGIGLAPMDPTFTAEIQAKYPEILTHACYFNHGPLGYHFYCVAVFFALACYTVLFRFVAFTPARHSWQKKHRNRIYRVCGALMVLACLDIGYLVALKSDQSIFWPETVAVCAFAVAWLVKGQTILRDPVA